jgi:CRP/FNR family cyclic AMP-dependent transcriptional regulator
MSTPADRRAATSADLAPVPLFASLSRGDLDAISTLFEIRSHDAGAIVATEGELLERFNIVLEGRVQFFWRDESGYQVKLGIDGPGGHFADVTLGGEPILMSVIALEDLRVATIRITDLLDLARRFPQVGVVLLMDVVMRLRRLVKRTKSFTMEDVYGRVVELLLSSATETSARGPVAMLTQAEIGQRVGATREMVGKVLRDLARGGYIEASRGRVTILRTPPGRW